MKNNPNNEHWFSIKAKDGSRVGYWSGKTKEDACEKFGLSVKQCSVRSVIRTKEGFIELGQSEQGKLL